MHRFIRKTVAGFTAFALALTGLYGFPSAVSAEVVVPAAFHLELDPALGTVDAVHPGPGPLIFHLQTAHGHYTGQKKIARILAHLKKSYGLDLLLIEGSSFPLRPELLDLFPQDPALTRRVADRLARRSLVKGPELFMLGQKGLRTGGLEDPSLYRENLEAFRGVLAAQKRTARFLTGMQLQIERLTGAYLGKDLRNFLNRLGEYEDHRLELDRWLEELKQQAENRLKIRLDDVVHQIDWPMLVRFFTLRRLEENLDFQAYEKERKSFLTELQRLAPEDWSEIETLLEEPLTRASLPDPGTTLLFEKMARSLPRDFAYENYPNVTRFIGHLMLRSEIRAEALFKEIDRLQRLTAEAMASTPEEKGMVELLADYRLLQRLFRLELSPADFSLLKEKKDTLRPESIAARFLKLNGEGRVRDIRFGHLPEIEALYEQAVTFYTLVRKRDEVMAERLVSQVRESNARAVAIVTGGFHSQPLEDFLRTRGYSYARISPALRDAGSREDYIESVLQPRPPEARSTMETVPFYMLAPEELREMGQTEEGLRYTAERLGEAVEAVIQETRRDGDLAVLTARSEIRPETGVDDLWELTPLEGVSYGELRNIFKTNTFQAIGVPERFEALEVPSELPWFYADPTESRSPVQAVRRYLKRRDGTVGEYQLYRATFKRGTASGTMLILLPFAQVPAVLVPAAPTETEREALQRPVGETTPRESLPRSRLGLGSSSLGRFFFFAAVAGLIALASPAPEIPAQRPSVTDKRDRIPFYIETPLSYLKDKPTRVSDARWYELRRDAIKTLAKFYEDREIPWNAQDAVLRGLESGNIRSSEMMLDAVRTEFKTVRKGSDAADLEDATDRISRRMASELYLQKEANKILVKYATSGNSETLRSTAQALLSAISRAEDNQKTFREVFYPGVEKWDPERKQRDVLRAAFKEVEMVHRQELTSLLKSFEREIVGLEKAIPPLQAAHDAVVKREEAAKTVQAGIPEKITEANGKVRQLESSVASMTRDRLAAVKRDDDAAARDLLKKIQVVEADAEKLRDELTVLRRTLEEARELERKARVESFSTRPALSAARRELETAKELQVKVKAASRSELRRVERELELKMNIPVDALQAIAGGVETEMREGLSGTGKSSLKMIPSFVSRPRGDESGDYLALDLGGTNFRILKVGLRNGEIELRPENVKKVTIPNELVAGSNAAAFFGFLADQIKSFAGDVDLPLGFTFSFPVNQTGIASGSLIQWVKGFKVSGVKGKDVPRLLEKALAARGVTNVRIAALVNDTVGTLAATAYTKPDTSLGIIVGTGTNAAYWEGDEAVNMEWGNFNRFPNGVRLRYDRLLDKSSTNPNRQWMEKMVSGKYIGELAGEIFRDAFQRGLLFRDQKLPRDFYKKIDGEWVSLAAGDESASLDKIDALLKQVGIPVSSLRERLFIRTISRSIGLRSARVLAGMIAGTLRRVDPALERTHRLAITGSVYEKFPGYREQVDAALEEILGDGAQKLVFEISPDGSGVGAAVIAAIAARSEIRDESAATPQPPRKAEGRRGRVLSRRAFLALMGIGAGTTAAGFAYRPVRRWLLDENNEPQGPVNLRTAWARRSIRWTDATRGRNLDDADISFALHQVLLRMESSSDGTDRARLDSIERIELRQLQTAEPRLILNLQTREGDEVIGSSNIRLEEGRAEDIQAMQDRIFGRPFQSDGDLRKSLRVFLKAILLGIPVLGAIIAYILYLNRQDVSLATTKTRERDAGDKARVKESLRNRTDGAQGSRSDIRVSRMLEIYERRYQDFNALEPMSGEQNYVFDPAVLGSYRRFFRRGSGQKKSWVPRAADVYSFYIPFKPEGPVSVYLDQAVKEIIAALPEGTDYYASPVDTFHISLSMAQDLRPGDKRRAGSKKKTLDSAEVAGLRTAVGDEITKNFAYPLRLVGIRFNARDGAAIAVFEDQGETESFRRRLGETGRKVTTKVGETPYVKDIIHVTLFRLLSDIDAPALARLKVLAEKYKDVRGENLVHGVTGVEFGHETRWMHTRFEPGSQVTFAMPRREYTKTWHSYQRDIIERSRRELSQGTLREVVVNGLPVDLSDPSTALLNIHQAVSGPSLIHAWTEIPGGNRLVIETERFSALRDLREIAQFYIDLISKGDKFPEPPDAFLLLGNPVLRTFLEFANAWKKIRDDKGVEVPIVLAGGVGRGTLPLLERLLTHYRTQGTLTALDAARLEPALEALKQHFADPDGKSTASLIKEADILKFLLLKEGIPESVIRVEEQPSSKTAENFIFSENIVRSITGGKTNPVIGLVTAPHLLLRAHAFGRFRWQGPIESENWQLRRFKTFGVNLDALSEEDLVEYIGYVAGYPEAYTRQHDRLFKNSELKGAIDPVDAIPPALTPGDWALLDDVKAAFSRYLDASQASYDAGRNRMVPRRSEIRIAGQTAIAEKLKAQDIPAEQVLWGLVSSAVLEQAAAFRAAQIDFKVEFSPRVIAITPAWREEIPEQTDYDQHVYPAHTIDHPEETRVSKEQELRLVATGPTKPRLLAMVGLSDKLISQGENPADVQWDLVQADVYQQAGEWLAAGRPFRVDFVKQNIEIIPAQTEQVQTGANFDSQMTEYPIYEERVVEPERTVIRQVQIFRLIPATRSELRPVSPSLVRTEQRPAEPGFNADRVLVTRIFREGIIPFAVVEDFTRQGNQDDLLVLVEQVTGREAYASSIRPALLESVLQEQMGDAEPVFTENLFQSIQTFRPGTPSAAQGSGRVFIEAAMLAEMAREIPRAFYLLLSGLQDLAGRSKEALLAAALTSGEKKEFLQGLKDALQKRGAAVGPELASLPALLEGLETGRILRLIEAPDRVSLAGAIESFVTAEQGGVAVWGSEGAFSDAGQAAQSFAVKGNLHPRDWAYVSLAALLTQPAAEMLRSVKDPVLRAQKLKEYVAAHLPGFTPRPGGGFVLSALERLAQAFHSRRYIDASA